MMTNADPKALTIRQALSTDIKALSQLRLEALQNEPLAFSSDYQTYKDNSPADWETWFHQRHNETNGVIFVADVGHALAGMMGIFRGHSPKTQHNGMIWGVYVKPGYRRHGIGRQLTAACIKWAGDHGVDVVKLGVNTTNTAAIELYAACDFQVYGLSPKALRYDHNDYGELLMVRELTKE